MPENIYTLCDTVELISPALIYYKDIIQNNLNKAISLAGSVDRLWPHVKTHKTQALVKLQIEAGINRFKCATIAEAEMTAMAGAQHILLAYPLVGPNIKRFIKLISAYQNSIFYAIGDDYEQITKLSVNAAASNKQIKLLIDVNMGMNRTGVPLDYAEALYERCASLENIEMVGMHCYDGNHNIQNYSERFEAVAAMDMQVAEIQKNLSAKGIACETLIMGGTPSFPCHARFTKWFLSPGTAFITDMGYYRNLPDLSFIPGAAVFTRVISHPAKGMFTIDLGCKAIASDPIGVRGIIVGMEDAVPQSQSEEHWVFAMPSDKENDIPPIGAELYVIPTHICPTSALYPEIQVAQNGRIVDSWEVSARNRKINY
jgi:D-serine deaminase-like pyridoxal phosphate-dependent protein